MIRSISVYGLLITFLLVPLGCGHPTPVVSPPGANPGSRNPPDENIELSPTSKNVVYASGWSEIIIHANTAKTTISTGAHFTTSQNACGKQAYGAIGLEEWNQLAKNANSVVQKRPEQTLRCVSVPEGVYPYMDGTVEIKLTESDKKKVFEFKDGEICSQMGDSESSDALLQVIHKLVALTDKEDCPNGYGSG